MATLKDLKEMSEFVTMEVAFRGGTQAFLAGLRKRMIWLEQALLADEFGILIRHLLYKEQASLEKPFGPKAEAAFSELCDWLVEQGIPLGEMK